MIRLETINPNASVLEIDSDTSPIFSILFSYGVPVVYLKDGKYYRNETKYSVTTSKHVNTFLRGAAQINTIKDEEFQQLIHNVLAIRVRKTKFTQRI